MYCPNCGKKLNEDEKFCSGCGKKVGTVNSLVPKDKAKLPVVMDVTTRKEKSKKPVGLIAFCCVLVVALLVCGGVLLKDVLFPSYTTVPQSESVSTTVTTPKPTPTATPTPEIDEDEVLYQETIKECEELKAKGEYIKILKKLERLSSSDSRYQKKYEQYEAEMIESVLSKAEEFADVRDFENAIKSISSIQTDYDCEEFRNAISNYREMLPRKLYDCYKIISENVHIEDATDTMGNYYNDVLYAYTGSITYNVKGKYENLSGIFAPKIYPSINPSKDALTGSAYLTIYGDGVLLFESKKIEYTDTAIQINVDITGVQQLQIVFNRNGWRYAFEGLLDATVS